VKHIWKFILPMHLAAVAALVAAGATGELATMALLAGAIWVLLSIGIEVGAHRLFSHRAFAVSRPVELLLAYLASLAGQGTVVFWVAVHRGYHHPHADTERDPHSRVAHGLWHSYLGWLIDDTQTRISYKGAVNLMRDPWLMRMHNWYYTLLLGSMLLMWLAGGWLLLGAYAVAFVVCIQQNLLVNVMCHHDGPGSRRYETRDHSRNIGWLSWLTWGLSLHNNHHADPGDFNFARGPREFDPSAYVIRLIRKPA
jgi:fatty-acid desaturase